MDIEIRAVNPDADDGPIAKLWSTVNERLTTPDMLREWYSGPFPPGYLLYRAVGLDADQKLVGYILLEHDVNYAAGRFALTVMVDPASRHQGIGTQLYEHAIRQALSMGATCFYTAVRENQPESLRFAEKRGFVIARSTFESILDLRTFDESRFAGLVESVEATGIRFFSLAEAGDTEAARRKLHFVNFEVVRDDPGRIGSYIEFAEFNRMFDTAAWFRADGQILAADGDNYVGLAAVGYFAETNSTYNMITGVLPAYRGRKIAQALKMRAIRWARTTGADYIRTHNDSQNAPMLAINRKFGYKPGVATYRMAKD